MYNKLFFLNQNNELMNKKESIEKKIKERQEIDDAKRK